MILDCYQNDFDQRKSVYPVKSLIISLGRDQRLKIFFLRASDKTKGKEYQPLIAQISADKKGVAKGLIITNIKIILIANWNEKLYKTKKEKK